MTIEARRALAAPARVVMARPGRTLYLAALAVALLCPLIMGQTFEGEESNYGGLAKSVTWESWEDPCNAEGAPDDKCASLTLKPGGQGFLDVTGFGFGLPVDATITGIQVWVKAGRIGGNPATKLAVQLMKYGVPVGNEKEMPLSAASTCEDTKKTPLGDRWGVEDWDVSDVNASGFGVRLSRKGTHHGERLVDAVQITVYYDVVEEPPFCYGGFDGDLEFASASLADAQAPSYRGSVSTKDLRFYVDTNQEHGCDFRLSFEQFESTEKVLTTTMTFGFVGESDTIDAGFVQLLAPKGENTGSLFLTVTREGHNDPEGTYIATVSLMCVDL